MYVQYTMYVWTYLYANIFLLRAVRNLLKYDDISERQFHNWLLGEVAAA